MRSVSKIVEHPDYDKPSPLNNDIAVLILKEAFDFGLTIGGIPLAGKSLTVQPGTLLTVSGFGSTSINGDKPGVLHFVSLPLVEQSRCVKAYKKYPGKAKITDNMICAGFLDIAGKDACKGDSGGLSI